jgi:hypothetical protein
LTLTEFLLARIAEDEAAARRAGIMPGVGWEYEPDPTPAPLLLVAPARVLAECEAKRRIVAHLASAPVYVGTFGSSVPSFIPGTPGTNESASYVLALLAMPYADHPGYDEAVRAQRSGTSTDMGDWIRMDFTKPEEG